VEPGLDKLMPLLFLKLCAPKEAMRGAAEAALQGAQRACGAVRRTAVQSSAPRGMLAAVCGGRLSHPCMG
jgi:hypothetical protein